MVPKVEVLEEGGGSEGSVFIILVLPKPILIDSETYSVLSFTFRTFLIFWDFWVRSTLALATN